MLLNKLKNVQGLEDLDPREFQGMKWPVREKILTELLPRIDTQSTNSMSDFKRERRRVKQGLSTGYSSQKRILAERGLQSLFAKLVVGIVANLKPAIKVSEGDVTSQQPSKVLKLIETLVRIYDRKQRRNRVKSISGGVSRQARKPNQVESTEQKNEEKDPLEATRVEVLETRIIHLERQAQVQQRTIKTLLRILDNLEKDEPAQGRIDAVKREIRNQLMLQRSAGS